MVISFPDMRVQGYDQQHTGSALFLKKIDIRNMSALSNSIILATYEATCRPKWATSGEMSPISGDILATLGRHLTTCPQL